MFFGSGICGAARAADAAAEAARRAAEGLEGRAPKMALVFASPRYEELDEVPAAVRHVAGEIPVTGGTAAGAVFGPTDVAPHGVAVVLLAGDDFDVACRVAPARAKGWSEVVEAARAVAASADAAAMRGLLHFACLVFAPGVVADGEAVVAAVRKGAGVRAQLAGALTGDELTMDRARVFAGDKLTADSLTITGLFTRYPLGVVARHGQRPIGPKRRVTRAEEVFLFEIDGKPALDVWLEDARRAGAVPPRARRELAGYLLNHYVIGIDNPHSVQSRFAPRELLARAPLLIRDDGAIQLAAAIPQGARVALLSPESGNVIRTARGAASIASTAVGGAPAGALVFTCAQQSAVLGKTFSDEISAIRDSVGAATAGVSVFGEIARNRSDVDAFFNLTVTVVTFPAGP